MSLSVTRGLDMAVAGSWQVSVLGCGAAGLRGWVGLGSGSARAQAVSARSLPGPARSTALSGSSAAAPGTSYTTTTSTASGRTAGSGCATWPAAANGRRAAAPRPRCEQGVGGCVHRSLGDIPLELPSREVPPNDVEYKEGGRKKGGIERLGEEDNRPALGSSARPWGQDAGRKEPRCLEHADELFRAYE